jgi:acyl-coenzyme A thioesterase PaaI-like protein
MTQQLEKQRRRLKRFVRFYPPYVGAGVRVDRISEDLRTIEVSMPLKFWNRNYVGTHFGGSLYTMCDPFFMLILIHQLGPDYIVWDKAATIRFKRPGKGTVKAVFHISEDTVEDIRGQAEREGKVEPKFQVLVTDGNGNVIAEVDKLLYVRKKDFPRREEPRPAPPQGGQV